MSSIDTVAVQKITDPLFEAIIKGGAPDASVFPLGSDPELASYYLERTKTSMTREDFLAASCSNAEEFARSLEAYSNGAGTHPLAAHAPLVAESARALRALYRDAVPEAQLSPYIYQMF